jgi:TetR/AcrR family tetracycline transcriptional repressor
MRLTRDHVLGAALDLLDETGLDGLTMRRLATALGVKNGATYWHFPSKQALLEAMAETMLEGLTETRDPALPWDERLTELAGRLRRALLSRRDGARLFSAVFFPLPNALAYGETMTGILREAGLSGREAVWAVDTLSYFVVGHTIEEQLAASLPDGGTEARARLREALDPARHPNLLASADDLAAPHPEEHFHHGLRLIVDGIRLTAGCR